jgi:FkbM family methyltransferase
MKLQQLRARLAALTGYTVTRSPMPGTLEHHLRVLLDRVEVDCVVDVGAYDGAYGELVRRGGYDGRIVSYDPLPTPALRAKAGEDGRWTVREVACGSTPGVAEFHAYDDAHPFNSLHAEAPEMHDRFTIGHATRRQVSVVRLDEDALTGDSLLLKVDAQGHDASVLEGAGGLLDRVRIVQVELAATAIYEGVTPLHDMVGRLSALSFDPTGFFPLVRASDHLRVIEFDGVFLRRPATVQ